MKDGATNILNLSYQIQITSGGFELKGLCCVYLISCLANTTISMGVKLVLRDGCPMLDSTFNSIYFLYLIALSTAIYLTAIENGNQR